MQRAFPSYLAARPDRDAKGFTPPQGALRDGGGSRRRSTARYPHYASSILLAIASTACDYFRGSPNGQAQPIQKVFAILPDPPMFWTRNQDRRDFPQLLDNRLRIF